jgi:hypothetical protein
MLAIFLAWRPFLVVPYFVLACLVLFGVGLLLLELRDDNGLLGSAVLATVACVGLFLGGWFIAKAGWPPELRDV